MLKLILFTLTVGTQAMAFQQTDFACQQQCLNQGSMYQFCQQKCTYEVQSPMQQPQVWEQNRAMFRGRQQQDQQQDD